jgi:hypothetical protein
MSEVDRFDKFITEGYIPFGKEKLRSENDVNDMETVGGGTKPSAFNSFITGDWYDDIEWGFKVIMNEKSGKPIGFSTRLTTHEYHSIQSDSRTHVGGPVRASVADFTAGTNALFFKQYLCPMTSINITYDKPIKVGQTLITSNLNVEVDGGKIIQTGEQYIQETKELIGTYQTIHHDPRYGKV